MISCFFTIRWTHKSVVNLIYPLKYEDIIFRESSKYNLKKELIFAIIKCESGFDEKAHSHADARGLMQITPETFEWLKKCYTHEDLDLSELENPEVNIPYGVLFVSILMKKYKNEEVALSAYNAGMTTVDRWLSNRETSDDGIALKHIPYKETRNYVKKVQKSKKNYKKLYFKSEAK